MILSSGPLQGYTDDIFRFVHSQIYGGIDFYFGPYIRLENHKAPKTSQIRDIESSLNKNLAYIPQILSKEPLLIIDQILKLQQKGYERINWNLGCPYPMVTKRNMGSGLLNQPELIREILHHVFSETKVNLSIKCRLGLDKDEEIFSLIEVFNDYNLSEIIIHARTAKQMYKGAAKPKIIMPILSNSRHPIAYNGDLKSSDDFKRLNELFNGKVHHFMIGRGLISNPDLAGEIKGTNFQKDSFIQFHNALIEKYLERYQEHQLLKKMQAFWEYFGLKFPDRRKELKKIRKAQNWKLYINSTHQLLQTSK